MKQKIERIFYERISKRFYAYLSDGIGTDSFFHQLFHLTVQIGFGALHLKNEAKISWSVWTEENIFWRKKKKKTVITLT